MIKIVLKDKSGKIEAYDEPSEIQATIKLNAKRGLNGDIYIYDHPELDIIVSPSENKIITMAKTDSSKHVYDSQDDLFQYMVKKGVVSPGAVVGGNMIGIIEAPIMKPSRETVSAMQVALYVINSYLDMESENFRLEQEFEENELERIYEPDPYTELGDIPHASRKGSRLLDLPKQYFMSYFYE